VFTEALRIISEAADRSNDRIKELVSLMTPYPTLPYNYPITCVIITHITS